jgi:hypothetical protein
MGRFSTLMFGMVLGGAAIYGAFSYHIIKADSGFTLVTKRSASLSETYVDIRSFTLADWAKHPELSADIVAAEKQQLLTPTPQNAVQGAVQGVMQGAVQQVQDYRR